MALANEYSVGGSTAIRIVRREEPIRSVQRKGSHMRLLYENEWLEILNTEVEPGNSIGSNEFWDLEAVHCVIAGGILFQIQGSATFLLPWDSVSMREGEEYRICNPTSSRSVLWSLLVKKSEPKKSGTDRRKTENTKHNCSPNVRSAARGLSSSLALLVPTGAFTLKHLMIMGGQVVVPVQPLF
jgi:hypothetical protein